MNLEALMGRTSDTLTAAGIEGARLETGVLIEHVTGLGRMAALTSPEQSIDQAAAAEVALLAQRRSAGEPIAHLTGHREFWSLEFQVSRHTLIPRPDSETLIEAVLAQADGLPESLRILDLGTGSGCLLLALLAELPVATGVGADISGEAVTVAAANAARLGLAGRARFVTADWSDGKDIGGEEGGYHVVISNPPYVTDAEWVELAPGVRAFEPALALKGGRDGLDAYRTITARLESLLAPGGLAIFEIGAGQAASVTSILAGQGLKPRKPHQDLAGLDRCIIATY
ncbi:MAG: peptide chain release factor N(5)-glutamine methyltransferase [Rhodospirillaceae bacterium]|nr:peptide chain release factor N(5)-glutamine methyltransferase [Rhodospirillaceae bacterium]